ncbi:MAG TPA: hypothetical protein DCX89_02630, partial [Saprospirales bacterium]|nr:hypothetical protein [Saprospirales bacterium]
MKKLSLYIIIALFSLNLQAQDAQGLFNIPIKNWNMQVIGLNHFYPIYLADPLDVRFEVSARDMKYSDVRSEER